MTRQTWIVTARAVLSAALVVGSASPVFAADKKKGDKDQGEAARDVLDKQKDIAKALKEKKQGSTDALQKQLDELKADLATETTRHTTAAASLQEDLKAATAEGDKKKITKAEKAVKKEDDSFGDKSAALNKKIAAVQAKIDAAKDDN
jgi:hypothetical protein